MVNYDLIVIGFGKAGKTLAAKMNAAGKKLLSSSAVKLCMVVLALILRVSQLRL